MAGEKKRAGKEQSDVLKWVLVLAVVVVLGLLLYTVFPARSTGNIVASDSTLILGWSFSDGLASDISSEANSQGSGSVGYNLVKVDAPTFVTDPDGADTKAIAFDGKNDALKLPKINSPLSYPLNAVTVVGRFKTTALTTTLVSASGDVPEQNTEITGSWVSQRNAFVLSPDTTGAVAFWGYVNGNWYAATSTAQQITLGTWEQWAGTYDGAELRVYKNGVLMGTQAVAGKIANVIGGTPSWVSDFWIGADGEIPNRFFQGRVGEVRVYSRALGETEIKKLYQSVQSPQPTGSGAVAAPVCGNGIKEGTETCDAGASNGACPKLCSATCTLNTCSAGAGSGSGSGAAPTGIVCGNGIKEGTETCDAGASNGACPKLCSAVCKANVCTAGTGSGDTGGTNTNTGTNPATQNNPGSNTGGGVGGGAGNDNSGNSGGNLVILTSDQFTAGKQMKVRVGDITQFKVPDVSTSDRVSLQGVSETQATFLVTSLPQIVILSKGESKKVDVNGDGFYDLILTVDSVNRALQQVEFTLKSIKEAVVSPKTTDPVVGGSGSGTNLGSGGTTGGTSISPTVIIIGVLLALLILTGLAWFFVSRRNAEKE